MALLISAVCVTAPSRPAAAAQVTVRVENTLAAPLTGAIVWVNVDDPTNVYTDATGAATVSLTTGTNYLIVARHTSYGAAAPIFPFVTQDTNITIVLPPRTGVRVATYNFLGTSPWTTSKTKALARILWSVQPDIIFAQETRTTSLALSTFQARYLFGYNQAQSTNWGDIRNAVLSFFPLMNVFMAGAPVMTRDLFGAETVLPGVGNTTIMSVHYKALKGTSEAATRDTEARFTAFWCSNLNVQAKLYMLGGDMNDDVDDATWLSHVHQILTNYNSGLKRTEPRDDSGKPATYVSSSYTSRLDYIYLAGAFMPYVQTARVFRTDTLANRPVWLRTTSGSLASDHSLVYVDITLVPEPAWGLLLAMVLAFSGTRRTCWRPR
jgi:endonuclease/exonuclease/phosphatase family metal-dependent hydrolase